MSPSVSGDASAAPVYRTTQVRMDLAACCEHRSDIHDVVTQAAGRGTGLAMSTEYERPRTGIFG